MGLWIDRLSRACSRSPLEISKRVYRELYTIRDRVFSSPLEGINETEFSKIFNEKDIKNLYAKISGRPYPAYTDKMSSSKLDFFCPNETNRVFGLAEQSLSLSVDILGSGPVDLEFPIPWHADFKAKYTWPNKFFRDIDILNRGFPSDVKVPWELSRLQWAIPIGQAYSLSNDEKYAFFIKKIIIDWIENNPYAIGVNWAVAMEPAMRVFSWTWFFHIFKNSEAWNDSNFKFLFLRSIYEHGIFIERYIEDYGVNGNHCVADAAALVFIGLFFGNGKISERWSNLGWEVLSTEIPKQINQEGINFEGSIAYHRFVSELFFWPAKYRLNVGLHVEESFSRHLLRVASFSQNYTKPNGLAPLLGDGDDGRVLPFGGQALNNHAYLPDLILSPWESDKQANKNIFGNAEYLWTYGSEIIETNFDSKLENFKATSVGYKNAGYFIMASGDDHVFIDNAPVGYAGRGGHGHNDCLSFEAVIQGSPIVTDSGSFVYTADYLKRDEFRGTYAHNTPFIDGKEQNSFISEKELFSLKYEAKPILHTWQTSEEKDIFCGSHSGYELLDEPVIPYRKIILEKTHHRLLINDKFLGEGIHSVIIPYRFDPACSLTEINVGHWLIEINNNEFDFVYTNPMSWNVRELFGHVSESYGVIQENILLEFSRNDTLEALTVGIYPRSSRPENIESWLRTAIL